MQPKRILPLSLITEHLTVFMSRLESKLLINEMLVGIVIGDKHVAQTGSFLEICKES